ncbi:Uu.00g002880.m01.CDS01 [Anthostomella pinea]|uniref:Uu.00g002880.m01.CDS01 n=1 Tax=Anthostomella pinea TaxID=933095 RepID=A0AAI8VEB5_9PEZI|nr:Uu.00g002880.m01.CDS01 [Anthostomella pinea]
MPRLPDQQQAHYFPHHHQPAQSESPTYLPQAAPGYQSQQISPLSTSDNASPTSPKSFNRKRLRPLFMPAVLRPTEHAPKQSPGGNGEGGGDDDETILSSNNSFISLTGLGALGRLSRRSTGDSGKCMEGDWNLDLFPKPTAQPTRQHWKSDTEAALCDEPSCMRSFNYFTRRHHCRKCGNIFCDSHSASSVPLDQDANYNPKGVISRACAHCYSDFQAWRSRTNSQASSEESSVVRGSRTTPASPMIATPTGLKPHGHHQEVAASVPRDWNWSTF